MTPAANETMPEKLKGLLWPTLMTLACLPVLIGLGNWQMERRAWKQALMARIEAGLKASPTALQPGMKWEGVSEYQPVSVKGTLLNERERYVHAIEDGRAGWHVYAPLRMIAPPAAGPAWTVIVNRGFVPDELKDPGKRLAPAGEITVEGYARMAGEKSMFTPETKSGGDTWFWRDLNGIAASMGLGGADQPLVPFFIEAKADAGHPDAWPRGGVTRAKLPNRHLEYALTWYGLAAALVGVWTVYVAGRLRR